MKFSHKNIYSTVHIYWEKNELLTYIPDYKYLFNGEMEDQVYINRLLKENYMRMKDQKTM